MQYDPKTNLLTRIDYPGGQCFTFEYDAAGRRTKRTDQDGHVENSTYDSLGRLDTMTDEHGALIVHYEYDAAGRLSKKTLGNGVYTLYVYDTAGEVTRLINLRADGSVLSRFDYTYDASGLQTSMTTLDGTFTYGYDPLGQLTSVKYPDGQIVSYDYDAAGNRIQVDDNGVVTAYVTNNLNEYTSVGDTTYTYDADGNMTSQTEGGVATHYTYDIENKLIAVTTPLDTWTYRYDALGNRVASTHNGVTTNYVIDPAGLGNLAAEYDGSGQLVARYDYGYGLLARTDLSGPLDFYTFSAIGSTNQLTDTDGLILREYEVDPFGVALRKSVGTRNDFDYAGQYGVTVDGTGLYFMRSRSYDPILGRFLEADPINVAGGLNLFEYAKNNPIALIDPSGLRGEFDVNPSEPTPNVSPDLGLGDTIRWPSPDELYTREQQQQLVNNWIETGNRIAEFNESMPALAVAVAGVGTAASVGEGVMAGIDGVNALAGVLRLFKRPDVPTGDPEKQQRDSRHTNDPNDKLGPGGFGDSSYIQSGSALPYQIEFQNEPTANAPVEQVIVTDTLDSNLDLDSFLLTEIIFANTTLTIPSGLDSYTTQVPFNANGTTLVVDVSAALDRSTRTLTLAIQAVDPSTGTFPQDPLVGFLYPDDNTGRGSGSISYLVKPIADLPSGTVISNRAQIVFDYNDPINTPLVKNTLDSAPPKSSVAALPATTTDTTLTLNWSGQDDAGGSGIAAYTIYASVDGAAAFPLISKTTDISRTISVSPGHTYSFYSIATDNVGHVQAPPSTPDATIQVIGASATTTVQPSKQNPTYGDSLTFTATVTPDQSGAGTPTGTVQFIVDGANLGPPLAIIGGVATSTPIETLSAGPHTVSAVYSGDTVFSPNNATDLPVPVSKATVTVKADDTAKVYGAGDPTLTYTITGLLNGDAKSVVTGITLSTTTGAAATAGTHTILATGGTAANYNVNDVNGTLTVSKAPLTVTADNKTKQLGAPDPALTYTVSGTFFYGDGASVVTGVSLSTATGPAAALGTHIITITGGTATNYTITDVPGTLTVTPSTTPPPPALVSMTRVQFVTNKKHLVTQILVTMSGPVNVTEAQSPSTYRLATAGKKNSFDAKNAKQISLKSAAYSSATNRITLTPKKPFALTKPVQLRINGQPPSALQDTLGRLIDGDHNGTAGGNAVAVLRRSGVTISAVGSVHSNNVQVLKPDSVDALFDLENPLKSNHVASAAHTIHHSSRQR
jgi:RHS repeat-associated protein